ncbi:hypothetical protein FISHEDRAFT_70904 [Fistulina hepatica ATCC 64428]|uniref:BZIP domain-containing protein n=1 Tax=Fistulina hepatica ATCC 64428 TaxID=1128425 RepID=A0A0D7AI54_9AGAR|nr:hypothetical protein FISHEDRAFT_70904 [Fistulina hepatica ATCC 64428]
MSAESLRVIKSTLPSIGDPDDPLGALQSQWNHALTKLAKELNIPLDLPSPPKRSIGALSSYVYPDFAHFAVGGVGHDGELGGVHAVEMVSGNEASSLLSPEGAISSGGFAKASAVAGNVSAVVDASVDVSHDPSIAAYDALLGFLHNPVNVVHDAVGAQSSDIPNGDGTSAEAESRTLPAAGVLAPELAEIDDIFQTIIDDSCCTDEAMIVEPAMLEDESPAGLIPEHRVSGGELDVPFEQTGHVAGLVPGGTQALQLVDSMDLMMIFNDFGVGLSSDVTGLDAGLSTIPVGGDLLGVGGTLSLTGNISDGSFDGSLVQDVSASVQLGSSTSSDIFAFPSSVADGFPVMGPTTTVPAVGQSELSSSSSASTLVPSPGGAPSVSFSPTARGRKRVRETPVDSDRQETREERRKRKNNEAQRRHRERRAALEQSLADRISHLQQENAVFRALLDAKQSQ